MKKTDTQIRTHWLEMSPFFASFTETEREELARDSSGFSTYNENSTLCIEGDVDQALFIILSGEVLVFKNTPNGEISIVKLKTGSIIGELSLLRKGERISSVKAIEKTMAFKLTPEQIKNFNLQLQIKIKNQILRLVIRRYENLCEKYSTLSIKI
jgi:CRP/FNR family cyclic AMP-dependent transcriptional regulator